jgi:hypothetical protein
MAKDHGPSVKDDEQYEELRKQGESKEKAARIANTPRARRRANAAASRAATRTRARASGARQGDRHRGTLQHEQGRAHRRAPQPLTEVSGMRV